MASVKNLPKKFDYLILWFPILGYLILRVISNSHWFSGDYSYDPFNLPFNLIGNIFGYFSLGVLGPISFPLYDSIRNFARENMTISLIAVPIIALASWIIYKLFANKFSDLEKRIIIFGFIFTVVSLLPFLGLGNITSRYSYLSTMGVVFILVIILKKVYGYLEDSGREMAIGFTGVAILVFALFHIIQIQSALFNWHEAGNKTKRFFISMESIYTAYWSQKDTQFHFLDVPSKDGQAWVFPVGLPDAIWFAFKNPDAKVFIHNDTDTALQQAGLSLSHPVFRFTPDGNVSEVRRKIDPPPDLIMP